jgi:hypothetical protein
MERFFPSEITVNYTFHYCNRFERTLSALFSEKVIRVGPSWNDVTVRRYFFNHDCDKHMVYLSVCCQQLPTIEFNSERPKRRDPQFDYNLRHSDSSYIVNGTVRVL